MDTDIKNESRMSKEKNKNIAGILWELTQWDRETVSKEESNIFFFYCYLPISLSLSSSTEDSSCWNTNPLQHLLLFLAVSLTQKTHPRARQAEPPWRFSHILGCRRSKTGLRKAGWMGYSSTPRHRDCSGEKAEGCVRGKTTEGGCYRWELTSKGLPSTRPLYLQVSEVTETKWIGGGKLEELYRLDRYTNQFSGPELGWLAWITTDHLSPTHTKVRAGEPTWQG